MNANLLLKQMSPEGRRVVQLWKVTIWGQIQPWESTCSPTDVQG